MSLFLLMSVEDMKHSIPTGNLEFIHLNTMFQDTLVDEMNLIILEIIVTPFMLMSVDHMNHSILTGTLELIHLNACIGPARLLTIYLTVFRPTTILVSLWRPALRFAKIQGKGGTVTALSMDF